MAKITPKSTSETKTLTEKKAILDAAADKINQAANKVICGRIGKIPEIQEKLTIKWVPTASYRLNQLTGGGFPRGKFTIVAGNPDSGKTSNLLETIALNMKKDETFFACWLESENSLSIDYILKTFGIDKERFFFLQLDKSKGAEETLDDLNGLAGTGILKFILL